MRRWDPTDSSLWTLCPELEAHRRRTARSAPGLEPQQAQSPFPACLPPLPRRVCASPEHPLALFLDDLQWLDGATLDLIEDLLTHEDVRHLLLIGAYRDNEVGPTHPLMRKLEAIRKADTAVQDIRACPPLP